MAKYDLYLYDDCKVLKNLLNIKDEEALDLAEAELSRVNMMILYEQGFSDFSANGICYIHKYLFGDIYEWAGEYRNIDIQKREEILAGKSVWYSNNEYIDKDLKDIFEKINQVSWNKLTKEDFAKNIAILFPKLWQVHPFREGNTRTIVMFMTFFVEYYGYYFNHNLIYQSAGYVRNSLVLASLGEYSEYEHLEKILLDAIETEPIDYSEEFTKDISNNEKYKKYNSKDYKPTPHEYTDRN